MSKINIEVVVPSLGKMYEFLVPALMNVELAAELILNIVAENEGLKDYRIEDKSLHLVTTRSQLSGTTLEEAGVHNGSRLILV